MCEREVRSSRNTVKIAEIQKAMRDFDLAHGTTSSDEDVEYAVDSLEVLVKGTRDHSCLKPKLLLDYLQYVIHAGTNKANDEALAEDAAKRIIREVLDGIRPGGQSLYDEVKKGIEDRIGADLVP